VNAPTEAERAELALHAATTDIAAAIAARASRRAKRRLPIRAIHRPSDGEAVNPQRRAFLKVVSEVERQRGGTLTPRQRRKLKRALHTAMRTQQV
jgi:hypothetical protein